MFDTAAALDAARAVSDPTARVGAITGLMAGAMIERAAAGGSCTEDDLTDAGFTAAEIIEFAADAKALAASRAVRMIERPAVDGPAESWQALKDLLGAANRHGVPLDREGRRICERAARGLEVLRHTLDIAA